MNYKQKVTTRDDLKNLQLIQIVCSSNRAKDWTRQLLAKEIKYATHRSKQPSQQEQGIEMQLSRKEL
jgi:hypothetical protein